MERIVIEVDDTIAKKWRSASPLIKDEIAQRINIRLAKELMVDSTAAFKEFLDEVSTTMQQRGLTEKTLTDILKDNE
jgi:hypothetical protein